jgi:hypothetical protein
MNWMQKKWLWFLAVLAILEIVASLYNPYQNIPTADVANRKQITQSGWPEYLSIPDKEDKKRVIFIGNSQAVGYEMRDSSKTYFGILRDSLTLRNPNIDIQNWSTGGVRMAEMQILTAKAIASDADRIVFLIHADNFDLTENINLDFIDSDVKLLLADSEVYRYVQHMEIGKQVDRIDQFNAVLESHLGLLRWRRYWLDQSTILTQEKNDVFWYGNNINDGQVIDFKRFPNQYEVYMKHWHRPERLAIQMDDLDTNYATSRLASFVRFENQLHELSTKYNFEYEFIWTPYYKPAYSKETRDIVDEFFIEASLKADRPIYNLTYTVDSSGFLSRAHFNNTGHREFAFQLLKHWGNDL